MWTMIAISMSGCHKKPPEPLPTASLPVPVTAPLPSTPPQQTPVLSFTAVYFDFDRSSLRSDQISALEGNLARLRAEPALTVEIQGHCDERGTLDYNLALGERRANAAKQWLVSNGIAPSRIHTLSYGEERPADPKHDEAAWALNRRDEFHPITEPVARTTIDPDTGPGPAALRDIGYERIHE